MAIFILHIQKPLRGTAWGGSSTTFGIAMCSTFTVLIWEMGINIIALRLGQTNVLLFKCGTFFTDHLVMRLWGNMKLEVPIALVHHENNAWK